MGIRRFDFLRRWTMRALFSLANSLPSANSSEFNQGRHNVIADDRPRIFLEEPVNPSDPSALFAGSSIIAANTSSMVNGWFRAERLGVWQPSEVKLIVSIPSPQLAARTPLRSDQIYPACSLWRLLWSPPPAAVGSPFLRRLPRVEVLCVCISVAMMPDSGTSPRDSPLQG